MRGSFLVVLALPALLTNCSKQSAAGESGGTGPRIQLDSGKLAQERELRAGLRKELDSLNRDTSAKARDERMFVELIQQLRLLSTQQTLARIGYGIRLTGTLDDDTKKAIRDFERYHG